MGNELLFRLREAAPWSWPAPCPGPSTLAHLVGWPAARADELAVRYDLGPLLAHTGPIERDESLYTLDLLDRFAEAGTKGRGLDVGSKYGGYLPGLATHSAGGWDCIERDAHRRYLDGTTRRAVGEAIAARFAGCRFIAGDVRELEGRYRRITWFLPFVVEVPHLAWGLPRSLFDPVATLAAVWSLLEPGGELLVLNQGEAERDVQGELFAGAGIRAESLGAIESVLSPYRKSRFGWRARR